MLYGPVGCIEPCIPENADMLYYVHLRAFEDVGDSSLIDDKYIDEWHAYESVLERVAVVRKSAKAAFAEGQFQLALENFKMCVMALNHCRDPDVEERADLLEQLHVNICVCYAKLERPKFVLETVAEMRDRAQTNVKALYQAGRAHFALGDYDAAIECLNKAQRLHPQNREVAQQLKAVNAATLKYQKDMSRICRDALKTKSAPRKPRKAEEQKSHDLLSAFVRAFLENAQKAREMLPISLTEAELEIATAVAEENGLTVETSTVGGEKCRFLVKPEPLN